MWIGARPNFHCWPSVKSTRKIYSSSVTCLVLVSYCTSWWPSFDGSVYGILESCMFNSGGKQGQFDQWLDHKSCWQISSHITHHFVTSGSKVYFCHVSWRPSWIYANSKYCPKWAPGQPSWDCSRTPKEYKSSKNVTEESISRSHNEFKNRSNHFKVMNVNGSFFW